METAASWLTSIRLHRLATITRHLPRPPAAWSLGDAVRSSYRQCGGSVAEIEALIGLLGELSLADVREDGVSLTRFGEAVARSARKGDMKPLGLALIRTGRFSGQAGQLIEAGRLTPTGDFECETRTARTRAPQLLAVVSWWDVPRTASTILIPKSLFEELSAVWALLPAPTAPPWVLERKRVGDRAEMYTVQFERAQTADPTKIHWVARDSDSLGWDVEDHNSTPWRRIEVKGRRDRDLIFHFSQNEWEKAHEFGQHYELQFWGGIDLQRDPMTEYAALRGEGYPVCYPNLAAELQTPGWKATPTNWRVVKES